MKPQFNPEINLGHILVALTMVGALLTALMTFGGDFKVMQNDVRELKEFRQRQLTVNENLTTAIIDIKSIVAWQKFQNHKTQ